MGPVVRRVEREIGTWLKVPLPALSKYIQAMSLLGGQGGRTLIPLIPMRVFGGGSSSGPRMRIEYALV